MADLSTAPVTLQSALQECDSHIHRLEQLEVLPSTADWQFFRNLRNNLAHDYPETIDQTVMTLNTLHSHWPRLRDFYRHIRAAAERVL